jgi:competence protein ComEA
MRRIAIATAAVVVLAGAGIVFARLHAPPERTISLGVESTPAPRTPDPVIVVDVSGAVAHPGVYRLALGSRIHDALVAAGGMTDAADLVALNKAAPVRDGQRIYVPRPGETPPAGSVGSDAEQRVDINRATAGDLEALPGIGPSTAARIVRSRAARPFAKIEELQTRGLVTPRVFADIQEQITTR